MSIGIHPSHRFHQNQPKVHGRFYEVFHDRRFWAITITILLVIGTFAIARVVARNLQASFSYQPSYSP